jgi:acetyl esterase/lipase
MDILIFFFNLIKSRKNNSLAIFFPTYYLSPAARYPTQMIQCVEALRYILEERCYRPSQVILGGDSAGGNIVAAVLSHLAHPHESIEKLTISEPLAAGILMCPWTAIDPKTANFDGYYGADIETPESLVSLANAYMGHACPDYYTDANLAPPEWFSTYPVEKIQVLAGGNELLLPSINVLVNTLRVSLYPVIHIAEWNVYQ